MRESHYITTLKRTVTPTRLCFVDCESYPVPLDREGRKFDHRFRLAVGHYIRRGSKAAAREDTQVFMEPEDFWEWIEPKLERDRPIWICAHNANFDMKLLGLWEKVSHGEVTFKWEEQSRSRTAKPGDLTQWQGFAVLDSPPFILKARLVPSGKQFVVVDSMNFFRTSLKQLGNSIGIPKMDMPPWDAPHEVWADYCARDVQILATAMLSLIDLIEESDFGHLDYTASSTAMNAYRRRFLPDSKTLLVHSREEVLQLERDAYYGGICQPFFGGEIIKPEAAERRDKSRDSQPPYRAGPVEVYDYAAFYPSVMQRYVYPSALTSHWPQMEVDEFEDELDGHCAVARVLVDCEWPGYPVHRDGRFFYAVGRFTTTLTTPELDRAIMCGDLVEVYHCAFYQQEALFEDFVDALWDLRLHYRRQGNHAFEACLKLIMNSLYGKFGQKTPVWVDTDEIQAPLPLGYFLWSGNGSGVATKCRAIGELVQKQVESEEHYDSMPAIAAHVTAYGREKLLATIEQIGRENVLYCDTDSVHVLAGSPGLAEILEHQDKRSPGYLRLEGRHQYARYWGPKAYQLDDTKTIAGMKKNAVWLDSGKYTQSVFGGVHDVLSQGGGRTVGVEEKVYHAPTAGFPGTIQPDGMIYPIRLRE